MHIKDLNLTESDFNMLIEGLDSLPEKGMAGEIMGDLMMGMFTDKNNADAMNKIKAEREQKIQKEKAKKDMFKEDIKILQGKLLMFKRWLIENNALNQVNDILHPNDLK